MSEWAGLRNGISEVLTSRTQHGDRFILFAQGQTKVSFRPFSQCYIDFWFFIQFEKIGAFTQTLTSAEITVLCALRYALCCKVFFQLCYFVFLNTRMKSELL